MEENDEINENRIKFIENVLPFDHLNRKKWEKKNKRQPKMLKDDTFRMLVIWFPN